MAYSKVTVSFSLNKDMLARLDALAITSGNNRSQVVTDLFEKELGTDSEFGKQLKSNPELARIYNSKREALGLANLQQQMISLLETHDVQEIIAALKKMEEKDVQQDRVIGNGLLYGLCNGKTGKVFWRVLNEQEDNQEIGEGKQRFHGKNKKAGYQKIVSDTKTTKEIIACLLSTFN